MNQTQHQRWSKIRSGGFFKYVALNSISIVLGIFLVRLAIHAFSSEQVPFEEFLSAQLMNLGITALVLPFVLWGLWLYQESKYKKVVER